MLFGKELLTSAKHILDLFVKTITSAVCLCCHAWLIYRPSAGTKVLTEHLPFKDDGLFSNTTNTFLQDLDLDQSIKDA